MITVENLSTALEIGLLKPRRHYSAFVEQPARRSSTPTAGIDGGDLFNGGVARLQPSQMQRPGCSKAGR